MADGSTRAIEQLHVGDEVLAYDIAAGKPEAQQVTETFVHPGADDIVVVNGHLVTTSNHPFFANGRWVRADELRVGDELLHIDENANATGLAPLATEPVTALAAMPTKTTTYNIEVARHHDYFAGGILVHNKAVCQMCD